MDLKQLEYFKAISEYKNLTKASEVLFISQPYLSAVLSRLEDEVGHKLFLREKRGLILTEAGETLLYYANRLLSEMSDLREEMNHLGRSQIKKIRLSSENSIFVGGWLKRFFEYHKEIAIEHNLATPEKQIRLLIQGELDFAITTTVFPSKEFEQTFLKRDKYILLVHKSHPLASKKSIRQRMNCF